MLKQRILTVAVLLPLLLAGLFLLPNLYWGMLTGAVLGVAAHEWSRLAGYLGPGRWLYPAALVACALTILAVEHALMRQPFIYSLPGRLLYGLAAVLWLVIVPVWLYFRWPVRDPLLLALTGALVLLPFWHALVWLQLKPTRLLGVMGVIWAADIAAYFTGRAFGRHKLAPQISPGKTWEGVGGAVAAVAVYWTAVGWFGRTSVPFWPGLLLVVLLTAVAILGDLFESWMKRVAGLKDSGTLLPGHGGVLDRVDALTSALPLAALYFAYPLFATPS